MKNNCLKNKWPRLALGLPLLISLMLPIYSRADNKTPEPPPLEQRGYEDWFTFKYGKSYIKDPWVWGYTKEFAERFRMPEKWIEPDLKGVLAVAFRMTTIGRTQCGLGGKEDNCWPPLQCQFDVYYDNSIKLPWNRDDIMRDFFMKGISSTDHVHLVLQNAKWRSKYAVKNDPQGKIEVGIENGLLVDGKYSAGGGSITYFDREFDVGVGLIGWVGPGFCPSPIATAAINFFDLKTRRRIVNQEIKKSDAPAIHRMIIPESFMRRANAAYLRDDKPNQDTTSRLLQQFTDQPK